MAHQSILASNVPKSRWTWERQFCSRLSRHLRTTTCYDSSGNQGVSLLDSDISNVILISWNFSNLILQKSSKEMKKQPTRNVAPSFMKQISCPVSIIPTWSCFMDSRVIPHPSWSSWNWQPQVWTNIWWSLVMPYLRASVSSSFLKLLVEWRISRSPAWFIGLFLCACFWISLIIRHPFQGFGCKKLLDRTKWYSQNQRLWIIRGAREGGWEDSRKATTQMDGTRGDFADANLFLQVGFLVFRCFKLWGVEQWKQALARRKQPYNLKAHSQGPNAKTPIEDAIRSWRSDQTMLVRKDSIHLFYFF